MRLIFSFFVTITLQLAIPLFAWAQVQPEQSVEVPKETAKETAKETVTEPATELQSPVVPMMSEDPLQLLQAGLNWFNSKEYQKAFDTFIRGVEKDPNSLSFRLNAGLAAMKLGKKGVSLAYIRSAYSLDPNSQDTSRILQQVTEDARIIQIPRQILFIENLNQFARIFPLWICILLGCFALGFFIYRLWNWLPLWKQARLTGETLPPSSLNYFIFLTFGFFFALSLLQFYERSMIRGTIVANKADLRTLPEETAAVLTEFYEGFEVIIKDTKVTLDPQSQAQTEWLKIQYPGSFQGWVKANDVMITSLTSLPKNR